MGSRDIEGRPQRPPVLRRAVAGLVLVGVVAVVLFVAIHLILAVVWVIVGIAVVMAVLWALNTLLQMFTGGGTYGLGLLVILFFFGLAGGIVGRIKGSSFFIWFLVSFCVPFIGLVCAVMYRYESEELRRRCPRCSRVVKLYDAVCVVCGEELEYPEAAIASQAMVRERRSQRAA